MKIERLVIRNFRGFDNFALDLGGRSHFLIGQNAGGKSSLLTAIVRALGRDLSFTRADFRDTGQPIEIEVALSDFTVPERGLRRLHSVRAASEARRWRPGGLERGG